MVAHPPILKIEHLSRVVGDKPIVDDVSFDVQQGDIMTLVGPSGAGKSSLLRLINRLDESTAGMVYLDGQDYRQIPPRELRRRVGMVLQSAYLFPGTVAENIQFGPRQRGESVPPDHMERLLNRVGLPGYTNRSINNLSGGEAQRVSLARTLANSPQILLLDEPTSALDEEAKREVEELICEIIRERQLTCLLVSHDPAQAMRMANRAILLRQGKLVKIGTVEEILHAEPVLRQ